MSIRLIFWSISFVAIIDKEEHILRIDQEILRTTDLVFDEWGSQGLSLVAEYKHGVFLAIAHKQPVLGIKRQAARLNLRLLWGKIGDFLALGVGDEAGKAAHELAVGAEHLDPRVEVVCHEELAIPGERQA